MNSYQQLMLAFSLVLILSCSKKKEDTPPPIVTAGCFDRAQYTDQIPNFDFDNWGTPLESGGKYEEPCGGVWASGNPGTALTGQVTTTKTTDAISGTYAVEMKTVSSQNLIAGGSVYLGKFRLNLNNTAKSARLGMPFTYKPTSMIGFYKYSPVNGDSSNIIILLTKYNNKTNQRDTVGFANQPGYDKVTTFTAFDLIINYNYPAGTQTPDTAVVNFTSSKAAEFFKGEVGSTFIIDNCKFTY